MLLLAIAYDDALINSIFPGVLLEVAFYEMDLVELSIRVHISHGSHN